MVAHLSVCVSTCLSGCDVTQMLRLLFPQAPVPFPPSSPRALTAAVSHPQEKNVPGSHSAHPRLNAAAQVGAMCPTGSVTRPPRRSLPTSVPHGCCLPQLLSRGTGMHLEEEHGGQATSPQEPPISCLEPRPEGWIGQESLGAGCCASSADVSSAPTVYQELGSGQGACSAGEQKFPH